MTQGKRKTNRSQSASGSRTHIGERRVRFPERAQVFLRAFVFLSLILGLLDWSPASGQTPVVSSSAKSFTGRYLYGPEKAPIRIVIFGGYQCPDCSKIEDQLVGLMQTRTDINVSMKHFPFCKDCNPYMSRTMHPNGCWGARAAEAAGILWGKDGFWKMHKYLFSKRGSFQQVAELTPGFSDPNMSADEFSKTMTSEETLRRVKADCAEADSLGLYFTPMIFINGVELKGWNAPDALRRTVLEVAAANLPARTAAADHPPVALQKFIDDWRDEPVRALPAEKHTWLTGAKDARVRVVLWGDYQETGSVEADSVLRAYVATHDGVSLVFRHYPFNKECAPKVPETRFPNGCRAAWAAEAAATLGGNDAFWKMHAWLMKRRGNFDDAALSAAASGMGLDGAALLAAMQRDDVKALVQEDVRAADGFPVLRIGVSPGLYALPTVFINDRYIQRCRRGERNVLPDILEAAGKK